MLDLFNNWRQATPLCSITNVSLFAFPQKPTFLIHINWDLRATNCKIVLDHCTCTKDKNILYMDIHLWNTDERCDLLAHVVLCLMPITFDQFSLVNCVIYAHFVLIGLSKFFSCSFRHSTERCFCYSLLIATYVLAEVELLLS